MILRWAMIEGTALFSLVGLIVLQDAKQLMLFMTLHPGAFCQHGNERESDPYGQTEFRRVQGTG